VKFLKPVGVCIRSHKEEYFLNPKESGMTRTSRAKWTCRSPTVTVFFSSTSLRGAHEYSRFWTIGSGADRALGALYALYEKKLEAK
jgi:hypothetical protein